MFNQIVPQDNDSQYGESAPKASDRGVHQTAFRVEESNRLLDRELGEDTTDAVNELLRELGFKQ